MVLIALRHNIGMRNFDNLINRIPTLTGEMIKNLTEKQSLKIMIKLKILNSGSKLQKQLY